MQENGLARSPMGAVGIAGLALVTSTIAALVVLFGLRRLLGRAPTERLTGTGQTVQPAVDAQMAADMPEHFSEDLVIPGFTQTGIDIEEQDAQSGRSSEGV